MDGNMLSNLVRSGALRTYNPMESYQNAMAGKAFQGQMTGQELDNEGKMATMIKSWIPMIRDREDYGKFRERMTSKFGDRFDVLPQSFGSEEELQQWQRSATASAEALLQMKRGEKFPVSKLDEKTGLVTTIELTPDQYKGLEPLGLLKGYHLGKSQGQPWKPPERMKEEEKAQTSGKLEAEKEAGTEEQKLKRQKELEEFKAGLEKTKPNFKTFYDVGGKPHTIDVSKETPKKDWSEDRPSSESESYDKNLLVAAQAVGISPKKVKTGDLTKDEAVKVADKYKEMFGTESLIKMLMGGMMGGGPSGGGMKFDAKGNPIK
jgi:hypothetical protein